MSGSHATRQRFRGGLPPPAAPPRRDAGADSPIRRRRDTQSTERDLKRFITFLNVERGVSPLTVKKYVYWVKRLKAWARHKRKSLAELTTLDCRRWLIGMAKEAYSVSSINVAHGAANVFFRFLITEGDLDANPFEPLPYLPKEELLAGCLSPEEVERLMSVPDTSTYNGLLDRAVMELLYSSGMRVAELVNLSVGDINMEKRRILCMGKGSKQRIVIFGRAAREWLEKYLEARDHVTGGRKSRHLFLKDDGGRIYSTYVWRHVKAHGLMVGLKGVTPRTLRHSFATHLHAGGASIRHVQALLGHADMESTQVYTHIVVAHLRKSYELHHPRAKSKRGPPRAEGEGAEE